jgi:predicted ATP-dependent endonuclease of OLD family
MLEALDNGEVRAVVLVEGVSDRAALAVLARRRGMDLEGDGIEIVSMDGITNIGHFLDHYCAPGRDVLVTGLYDDAEERYAAAMAAAVPLERVPRPLSAVLTHVQAALRGFLSDSEY